METNYLTKEEKLNKVLYLTDKYDITAYELGANTKLNTSGIERILKKNVKNPREETINVLYDYIISKYEHNTLINETNEPKTIYDSKLTAMEELKNCLNERNELTREIVKLQIILAKNNIPFKNIFEDED